MTETDIARLTRERDEAREERDRARRDHEGACHLVAKMHHAATGAVTGPARGVVEDVADVRARLLAAESRASSLSRELLDAMQARDSYRMRADLRVGMRREIEEILGVRDTMGDEAFERWLARLRGLLAAESRAERMEEALRAIAEDECYQTTRDVGAHLDTCSEERPGDNSRWCAVCIARAALGEEGK